MHVQGTDPPLKMRVRIWTSTCVGLSECFGPTRGWLRVIRIVQVVVRGARIYSILTGRV